MKPYSFPNFTETTVYNYDSFPGSTYTFEWEEQLFSSVVSWNVYMNDNLAIPWILALAYCGGVFALRSYMSTRTAYQLKTPLIIWNTILAVFSALGSFRTLPEMLSIIYNHGISASILSAPITPDPRYLVWVYLFGFSKIWEFGDTVFILLRKQKLLSLHWIHHAITQMYCWYILAELPPHIRWPTVMNLLVHTIMYSYYALAAMGVKIPHSISSQITVLQIAQMVMGFYVCVKVYLAGTSNPQVTNGGLILYATFLVLFVKFFIDKYLLKSSRSKRVKDSKKTN